MTTAEAEKWLTECPDGTRGFHWRHCDSPSGPVILEAWEVTNRRDHLRFFWRMLSAGDRQHIAQGLESTWPAAKAMAEHRAGLPWGSE